jgi:hypothetical protein
MRFLRSPSSSRTSREKMTETASARFCGNITFGVLRWMRTVCLSGVSIPSISWNVNACTPSLAYCSKQYLMSAATSSRPLSGATLCHLTPWRSLKVHTRWSVLPDQDSARSPLSVRSVVFGASSVNGKRTRRLPTRDAIWKRPTEFVRRGSSTGGSQGEARVSVPPRFGVLGLGGIQSG